MWLKLTTLESTKKKKKKRVYKGLSTEKPDGEQGWGQAPVLLPVKPSSIWLSYQIRGHRYFDVYK